MAYDPGAEVPALLRRTIRGTIDFSGRSRRVEIGYYWLASVLLQGALKLALGALLTGTTSAIVTDVVSVIVFLPYWALYVRRLHDINVSGWLALIVPIGGLAMVPRMIAQAAADPGSAPIGHGFTPFYCISWLALVALFAMTITPGTIGPNRFGPDPREDQPDTDPS